MAISSARGKSASDEAMASTAYGSCYHQEGKFKEAEKWLGAAVRLNPGLAEAHVNLVNCYLAQDRVEEARKVITDAKEQAPHPIYKKLEARIAGNEGWGRGYAGDPAGAGYRSGPRARRAPGLAAPASSPLKRVDQPGAPVYLCSVLSRCREHRAPGE